MTIKKTIIALGLAVIIVVMAILPVKADDTGFKSPSATGEDYNQWFFNPSFAFSSNDAHAIGSTVNTKQDYYNFTFGVPAGATIDGITVTVEGKDSDTLSGVVGVELSWDGGASYTTSNKATSAFTGTDTVKTLGGASDTWGRTWTSDEFSNTNFRLRMNVNVSLDEVDHIQAKIHYTAAASTTSFPVNIQSGTVNINSGSVIIR